MKAQESEVRRPENVLPGHIPSDHAVDRYRERWAPGLKDDDAYDALVRLIKAAVFVEYLADEAQSIWATETIAGDTVRMVVDSTGVVRTVLPKGATRPVTRRGKR